MKAVAMIGSPTTSTAKILGFVGEQGGRIEVCGSLFVADEEVRVIPEWALLGIVDWGESFDYESERRYRRDARIRQMIQSEYFPKLSPPLDVPDDVTLRMGWFGYEWLKLAEDLGYPFPLPEGSQKLQDYRGLYVVKPEHELVALQGGLGKDYLPGHVAQEGVGDVDF